MRSYGHWCGVAKALDLVGDRWTLLIVRELLTQGPLRYTDLQRSIPGIATNLLADRVRDLEDSGLVVREASAPPAPVQRLRLTQRGEGLRPVLQALGRWGADDLPEAPRSDAYQPHWLALTLEGTLRDRKPDRGRAVLEVRTGDTPIQIEVDGTIRTRIGGAAHPDAAIDGDPRTVLAALSGRLGIEEAQAAGVTFRGDAKLLRRIRP